MSLRTKLVILVLFVALVPLSVSAYVSLGIHQQALERCLTRLHQATALQRAQRVETRLQNLEGSLQRLVTGTLPWDDLSSEELRAALWLLYRADEDIVAVVLLDPSNKVVIPPAYLSETTAPAEPLHLSVPPSIVDALLQHLPAQDSSAVEPKRGTAFLIDGDQEPILALRFSAPMREHGQPALNVAIGLSLRGVCAGASATSDIDLVLIDDTRRSLCRTRQFSPLDPLGIPVVPQLGSGTFVNPHRARGGRDILSTAVNLRSGWQVLAEQPLEIAFAASRDMRVQAGLWITISVAIALVSGLLLARSISSPVRRLMEGVRELAQGNLGHRLELSEDDEFSRLGSAFNHLAADLAARDAEIRGWNAELQQKVEDRTQAIARYHEHLVQAEKSSVIARLSAGVACEINDPLTGILGVVQLLAARARKDPQRAEEARLLANAVEGAQRIRELIKRVQALGQRQPRSQLRSIVVDDLLDSATGLVAPAFATAGIELTRIRGQDLPLVLGNFTQLEQAFLQVLNNALEACTALGSPDEASVSRRAGPRVAIETGCAEASMLLVTISDNGVGLLTDAPQSIFEPFVTLRPNSSPGLGLTIARRIIEEHGGQIWAKANAEGGATLCVKLPSASGSVATTEPGTEVRDG